MDGLQQDWDVMFEYDTVEKQPDGPLQYDFTAAGVEDYWEAVEEAVAGTVASWRPLHAIDVESTIAWEDEDGEGYRTVPDDHPADAAAMEYEPAVGQKRFHIELYGVPRDLDDDAVVGTVQDEVVVTTEYQPPDEEGGQAAITASVTGSSMGAVMGLGEAMEDVLEPGLLDDAYVRPSPSERI